MSRVTVENTHWRKQNTNLLKKKKGEEFVTFIENQVKSVLKQLKEAFFSNPLSEQDRWIPARLLFAIFFFQQAIAYIPQSLSSFDSSISKRSLNSKTNVSKRQ